MAGATESGEEFQTGRVNRAEDHTRLWAQVPPKQADFSGAAILIVEVALEALDPDDYVDGDKFTPSNKLDGIIGTGWSGGGPINFGGVPGGTGVVGRGGMNQGSGVVGLGGGIPAPGGNGAGGIGVHGLGGPQRVTLPDLTTPPGAGLVGQGGRQLDGNNPGRLPHAAGVIGIAGGIGHAKDSLPEHPLSETGGVGVYGQGAEVSVSTGAPTDGPISAGVGILGRGGVSDAPDIANAAGVVGLAGGLAIPTSSDTANSGVVGHGRVGVRGQGLGGPGISGASDDNRGGIFRSDKAAQIQLVPQDYQGGAFPPTVNVTPTAFASIENESEVLLPTSGRGGDLLVLSDDRGTCSLWFCVEGENGGPAQWSQVLMGPAIRGVV